MNYYYWYTSGPAGRNTNHDVKENLWNWCNTNHDVPILGHHILIVLSAMSQISNLAIMLGFPSQMLEHNVRIHAVGGWSPWEIAPPQYVKIGRGCPEKQRKLCNYQPILIS